MDITATLTLNIERPDGSSLFLVETIVHHAGDNALFTRHECDIAVERVADQALARVGPAQDPPANHRQTAT